MKITHDLVHELLHYNPDTGVFTWKPRTEKRCKSISEFKRWNSRFAGRRAGGIQVNSKTGYIFRAIKILRTLVSEHHLAWLYMTGNACQSEIDHKDRDATNNKWANLRKSTRVENNRNRSMSSRNTSGITGVVWNKASGKWLAQCKIKGKNHHLGYFETDELDLAAMESMEFRAEHGFDSKHGAQLAVYHLREGMA